MLAPAIPPSPRGNARTVARIVPALQRAGIDVDVAALGQPQLQDTIVGGRHDLIHMFHLVRSFEAVAAYADTLRVPYILNQTGTDLGELPQRSPAFVSFLCHARALVVYQATAKAQLLAYYPEVRPERVKVVLKSVDLPTVAEPLPEALEQKIRGRRMVLLPAHVRPVKCVETALDAFTQLHARMPDCPELVVAGKVLDPAYAASLRLSERAHVTHVELSREQMRAAYERASVVLNTSTVESSPNAVLEALYLGTPVLVRHIPGLTGLVEMARMRLGTDVSASPSEWAMPIDFFGADTAYPSLVALLKYHVEAPELLTAMGESARRAFAYLGDSEREGREYCALYQSTLHARM